MIGNQYYDFRVIGEPGRLIPELDFVILLAAGLLFAWIARRGRWFRAVRRGAGARLPRARHRVRAACLEVLPPRYEGHQQRVEFRLTDWVHRICRGVRTLATGSVRFWYNAWYDLPQLGGGSEQGLLNIHSQYAYGHAVGDDDRRGRASRGCRRWAPARSSCTTRLRRRSITIGASPRNSRANSRRSTIDAGDRIYRVPRRYPALARVVDARADSRDPAIEAELDYDSSHEVCGRRGARARSACRIAPREHR